MNRNSLILVILSVQMCRVTTSGSYKNFYSVKKIESSTKVLGLVEFDVTEYKPTCGWEALLTSNVALTDIEGWDFTWSKLNDYQYVLGNMSYNGAPPRGFTARIILHGPSVGSAGTDVTVYWSCVCNTTTNNTCQPIESPGNSPATTTQTPATALSLATALNDAESEFGSSTTTTDVATNVTPQKSDDHSIAPQSSGFGIIYLIKQIDQCYKGFSRTTATEIRQLTQCAIICIESESCEAINFRNDVAECDIIYDHSGPTDNEGNCEYYKLVSENVN